MSDNRQSLSDLADLTGAAPAPAPAAAAPAEGEAPAAPSADDQGVSTQG